MITRFVTELTTRFSPFSPRARTARSVLALLPPGARSSMKVDAKVLPRGSAERETLSLKFKDGKQLDMDLDKVNIKDVVEQVNRHSRALERKEDLLG